jgi:hypothetical protein
MGNKYVMPNFDGLIKTVALLVRHCDTGASDVPTKLSSVPEKTYEFTENARTVLTLSEFYDKTLREGYDGEALGEIVAHLAYSDEVFSKMIATVILKGLNEIEYEEVKSFYAVLDGYLTCADGYQLKRIEWVMGFPTLIKSINTRTNEAAFGASICTFINDEVYSYVSTLSFGQNIYNMPESILSLIWR